MTTRYNLRVPATELAENIYTLHNFVLIVCVLICVAVFGVMFYSIYAHRKSKGHKPAHFHESTSLEIAWTVVPFLIVVVIGVYATPVVMAQKDTTNADITVKATGHQWKWGYDYLKGEGQGIAFYSTLTTPYEQRINQQDKTLNYLSEVDNPLVVPVGKKIRVVTTANDVIHAWMVPAFGVKQDAIPGFVRDTWF
ncbi:MAG: cytochrome c oxidase subunit II, partial [Burkholderiaceae bacterium]|nr:cytochrome c oxidase subunit II [Burkholderiaceae bacterium]